REEEQHTAEAQRLADAQEQENAKKDDRKKNRNKFLDFLDTSIPSTALVIPSPLTTRKLHKGEFCELFFFINKGLAEAESAMYSVNNEALSIVQDENGLHSFIPAAATCAKNSVINDEDLSWPQFDEGAHCLLKAM
ncbi:hypothetical protein HD554DRAFT_1992435, partial [Boletus coccyginus]